MVLIFAAGVKIPKMLFVLRKSEGQKILMFKNILSIEFCKICIFLVLELDFL